MGDTIVFGYLYIHVNLFKTYNKANTLFVFYCKTKKKVHYCYITLKSIK